MRTKTWTTNEVVHVFLFRQTSSSGALYTAGQAPQRDHSPAGISHKECPEGLVPRYVENLDVRMQPVARAPKYSEAQKQAALEHFRTHDRCISATMRALGYPGRGTLTAWVREAFPETQTSMVGRSWHPGYCEEVQQAGVIRLCCGDETAQQVADRLGVSRPTLYSWKDQLPGHEAPSSMKRRKANSK